jgi:type II secretory pathway component PulJ
MPARKAPRPALLGAPDQRFRHAQQELHQLDYFLKGTVLKRMMKCGQPQCACHRDPAQRHGPYFEWTYKVKGKTVNVKLGPKTAPVYQAATKQNRKLKAVLTRMERLSRTALAQLPPTPEGWWRENGRLRRATSAFSGGLVAKSQNSD